jgi:hypothetical protein
MNKVKLFNDLRDYIGDAAEEDALLCVEMIQDEIKSVLIQLDELAELWGDEGKFRRCRDRLRDLVKE